MSVLQASNTEIMVDFTSDYVTLGVECFRCVFWTFGTLIAGFRSYRPVISIDGTHLYGKYQGSLLITTSCDASFTPYCACGEMAT